MPARSNPTARQARLGTELRRMREAADVSAREAAALLGVSPTQISHIESGRFGLGEERLRRLAAFYSCGDTALIEGLIAMSNAQRYKGWWEEYRGTLPAPLLDLAELEHHATYLRSVEVTDIPGLFQTEDYARTIFEATTPVLPARELDARVQHRLERRRMLQREPPLRFEVLVHEAALWMRFAGRGAARKQLDHLLEQSDQPNITVRAIPFRARGYIGSGHAMLHLGGSVPKLDTVQVEAAQSASFLDSEAQLTKYRAIFSIVEAKALSDVKSRDFIHGIAQEL